MNQDAKKELFQNNGKFARRFIEKPNRLWYHMCQGGFCMKKLLSAIIVLILVFTMMAVNVSAATPNLPTKEYQGETYYCVTTKAQYTALVNFAIENLLEEVLIYQDPNAVEYDSSWSNDVRNFCDYKSYRELKFLDYNTNVVSGYCDQKPIYDELNCFIGETPEAYGKLEIEYNDSRDEIQKAEAIINGVLAQVSGKSEVEKIEHIVNYICSVNQAGSIQMPGGGYDLINGVYDVLTGHHTNVVCTSYAVTAQKFFEMAGIESVMIHNSNHIWNMVCLDGVWYGIDVTFGDEGSTMSQKFLLMGYDDLKRFDDTQTPIATFKARHTLADKSYYNTSTTTAASSVAKTTKPTATTTKRAPSTTAGKTNDETTATSASETVTENSKTTTTSANKVTVDLTENVVISSDIFKTAKEKGEDVSLVGDGYRWTFSSDSIKESALAESFNAEVYVGQEVGKEAITAIANAADIDADNVYPFSFSHHGELPGVADITIEVAPAFKGKTVYIYYLNDENQPVQSGKGIVAEDGTLTFTTDHCSVWFLSEEQLETPSVLPTVLIVVGAVMLLAAAGVVTFLLLKRKQRAPTDDPADSEPITPAE